MPSSPKKTPKTGSALLGQELRRLRGGRTLRQIAQMTHEPPLAGMVGTLSEASLCEMESGKSMPTLASLHALSVIYKTSMSQLMAYVTEDRRLTQTADSAATPGRFADLLRERHWIGALNVALALERAADDEATRMAWRGNRATCLSRLGQHGDAVALFNECCESDALTPRQRFALLCTVASCHTAAGNLWNADLMAREALAVMEGSGASDQERAWLFRLRGELIVGRCHFGGSVTERDLREALRLLDQAETQWDNSDSHGLLGIGLDRAAAYFQLGNSLVAERDTRAIEAKALKIGFASVAAQSKLLLAKIAQKQGKRSEALASLESAASLLPRVEEPDVQFEVHFETYKLLRDERPGKATAALRECDRLFPLLMNVTPLVRAYQRTVRARS